MTIKIFNNTAGVAGASGVIPDKELATILKGPAGMGEADGLLPLIPLFTIVDGASTYPRFAAKAPSFIVGNDIIVPADFDGAFDRNLGGLSGNEFIIQQDATAVNGLSGTVLGAGVVGSNRRTGGTANSVRTGQTRAVAFSGDPETRPKNYGTQHYLKLDTY